MIKSFVQALKCCDCKKPIGDKAEVVESKTMPGTYLTFCPHCAIELMTAGQNLIKIPDSQDNKIAVNIRKELAEGLSEIARKKIEESDLSNDLKQILKGVLSELEVEIEKEIAPKETVKEDKDHQKKAIVINLHDAQEAKTKDNEEEKIMTRENHDDTAYVVLLDGDVHDEYTKDVTPIEIFNEMVAEFGEEAVINGDVKLYELKEIKPKLKKKITYVLDM
jgi:hypothetical protein